MNSQLRCYSQIDKTETETTHETRYDSTRHYYNGSILITVVDSEQILALYCTVSQYTCTEIEVFHNHVNAGRIFFFSLPSSLHIPSCLALTHFRLTCQCDDRESRDRMVQGGERWDNGNDNDPDTDTDFDCRDGWLEKQKKIFTIQISLNKKCVPSSLLLSVCPLPVHALVRVS